VKSMTHEQARHFFSPISRMKPDSGRSESALQIAQSCGGKVVREGRGYRCICPIHGGFSLNVADGDNGRVLVTCWAGCDSLVVLAELRKMRLLWDAPRADDQVYRERQPLRRSVSPTTESGLKLWNDRRDARGTIGERYVIGRGFALPPDHNNVLGFLPNCPFKGQRVPALIALFRDIVSDEPCGDAEAIDEVERLVATGSSAKAAYRRVARIIIQRTGTRSKVTSVAKRLKEKCLARKKLGR
jgi:hypothetical protein